MVYAPRRWWCPRYRRRCRAFRAASARRLVPRCSSPRTSTAVTTSSSSLPSSYRLFARRSCSARGSSSPRKGTFLAGPHSFMGRCQSNRDIFFLVNRSHVCLCPFLVSVVLFAAVMQETDLHFVLSIRHLHVFAGQHRDTCVPPERARDLHRLLQQHGHQVAAGALE